ncbi:MAG: PorV/PorQ family protein [Elusimicrobiota bacterium]
MNARTLAAAAAAWLLAAPSCAADFSSNAIGTAGAEFLTVDVDPRGIAMGTAFTAVTGDAFSMYWNPAGLSLVPRAAVSAMHTEYLVGIRYQYFSYAQRITDASVVAGAFRYMDAGSITNTDMSGNELGTFRPRNYVFEGGWGKTISEMTDSEHDVSLGISGRVIHSDLVAHADGFCADMGVQAHYSEAYVPYNFGMVLQNIGRGQKFDRARDPLPLRLRIGASILPKPFLLLSMDAIGQNSNQPYGALGGEFSVDTPAGVKLMVRGGYNSRLQFKGPEGLRGISGGIGIRAGDFSFDYAIVPLGILGDTHRFSVSWSLPAKRSRKYRRRGF